MNTLIYKILSNQERLGDSRFYAHALFISLLWLLTSLQPAHATWKTIVSLNFDDGLSQPVVQSLLKKHGMKATFYVNSNRIGTDSLYMTRADLDALVADGHEIGGHTINHVDLATLSDADQKTAICDDMKNLVNWGYSIHSFAYPFGSVGVNTQAILAGGCPGVGSYDNARAVGGLVSGVNCKSCPWADTIPPATPYYLATNTSINSTTTLATLQSYVMQAEANGGGWIPLVFHYVCNNTCTTNSISPDLFDQFLTWLETRTSVDTYVRTMHQVMSGDLPQSPPTPNIGANLLTNPSLENDTDKNNQADCWQRTQYGSNSANWSHVNNATTAHSGSFSEQLNVTQYSSGDNQLVPTQDAGQSAGGCAPTVSDKSLYQLSAWYKSTLTASSDVFYLDANSNWHYWKEGPEFPATANWSQMIFYPGVLPTGAKALSFGLYLAGVGTLVTDDYALAEIPNNPPPADTTPPVITNVLPANGTVITGTASLSASVSDNTTVKQVDFLINGASVATVTSAPYSFAWDSTKIASGNVSYSVSASDTAGNKAVSNPITLSVQNDLIAPVISFMQPPTPVNGASVASTVPLQVSASDNVGVSRVDFLVNGAVVGSATSAPYAITWNSLSLPNGSASVTATAYDTAGNTSTTPALNITVNNIAGNLLNNPSLEIDANNDNLPDCWQITGYGSNTYTLSRLSGASLAHNGNFAESLVVSRLSSGDRKIAPSQDTSTCAPTVSAGKTYTLSGWYKSTVYTGIDVYYRTSAGDWTYWVSSDQFAAANNWTQASYTTPPLPTGAVALSFGFFLEKKGTLITDDYSMVAIP